MSSVWTDFTTENANGTARKTGKFAKFLQRDQAGIEAPFEIYWGEVSQSGVTYPTFGSLKELPRLYVPTSAWGFLLHFEAKVSAGTGYLEAILGGIPTTPPSFSGTSYAFVSMSWSDIRSLRGQNVDLELRLSNSGFGNTTYAKSGESQFAAPTSATGFGKAPGAGRVVCAMFTGAP